MKERPGMSNEPLSPSGTDDSEHPSARGILLCLRQLAEEAAALRLGSTTDALYTAIAVCAAESERTGTAIAVPGGATKLH
jgi:hypothetical protein